ncbi:MAG TPA: ABC transporter permease [Clostridia bacterium]|nr:ABC transporter permease [Clostridia bacterium]
MTKKRIDKGYLLSLFLSVSAALLLGAVIILLTGHNPLEAYAELVRGSFGLSRAIGNTLAKTVTLAITALATAVGARAGIFNVGGEGQLFLGGMAAAMTGVLLSGIPAALAIPLAFLTACAAGGLYALIPALLKVKLKVNEVITTVMLNSVAIYFCTYLANGPLKTSEKGIAAGTPAIEASFRFFKLIPLSDLTSGVFYAAGIALIVWYVMSRTATGYEMKLTGQNRRFAFFSGLPVDRITILAMVASGAMCGAVGMFEVYGIHGRFMESISKDFYFDGMLVAMIMRYEPVGILLMSVFFAALKIGGSAMELNTGISSELILVIQSIIIFFMAAESGITASIKEKRARRISKQERKTA